MDRRILYFFASLLLSFGVTWIVQEPTFTQGQVLVLFLLFFSVCLWLTEAVPPFSVGLFIMGFLAFAFGYDKFTSTPVDVGIYINTFSSSIIWLMLGGFFLASAMSKAKLDISLINATLKLCGTSPKRILFGVMLITLVPSMLISNAATTAMLVSALMPLLVKLGKGSKMSKGIILGVTIAATTGGMGTVIGSPPNAITLGALQNAGKQIDFISWMLYGIPVMIVLTALAWYVLTRIFIKSNEGVILNVSISDEQKSAEQVSGRQRWIVIVILSATIILWLTSPLHGLSAAAVSAVPLVFLPLTRILTGEDLRAMGWDTLILVAGGLSLGLALEETGLLFLYANRIASLSVSPLLFYLMLGYAAMIFSNIMSNSATTTVLVPLGMAILPTHQVEVALIISLSTSTALFLPVSTPPNAIAYSTGFVDQKDFRIGGLLIGLLGPVAITIWVLIVFSL